MNPARPLLYLCNDECLVDKVYLKENSAWVKCRSAEVTCFSINWRLNTKEYTPMYIDYGQSRKTGLANYDGPIGIELKTDRT